MIFVHDKGRMANNILQYGHVYAWGREHGRQTMSMRFAYKYPWFHICHSRHHNFPTYVFAKYAAKLGLIPTVHFDEENADYSREEQQMLKRKMILVDGWYARFYDLFLKYKQDIIDLFQFDETVRKTVNQMLTSLPAAHLRLGVHIRRGDYRTWQGGRYFFNDEQYIRQIRQFMNLHEAEEIQVFICGNDPELNEEIYRNTLNKAKVYFPKGNPAEDLYLLSCCDFLMGAPSTFSLVASMYHNTPLYWIEDPDNSLSNDSFQHFDTLFKQIK